MVEQGKGNHGRIWSWSCITEGVLGDDGCTRYSDRVYPIKLGVLEEAKTVRFWRTKVVTRSMALVLYG